VLSFLALTAFVYQLGRDAVDTPTLFKVVINVAKTRSPTRGHGKPAGLRSYSANTPTLSGRGINALAPRSPTATACGKATSAKLPGFGQHPTLSKRAINVAKRKKPDGAKGEKPSGCVY
jgi:hypothetical protein